MEYEVKWDEDIELWGVFRGDHCVATWPSKELADESAARLNSISHWFKSQPRRLV